MYRYVHSCTHFQACRHALVSNISYRRSSSDVLPCPAVPCCAVRISEEPNFKSLRVDSYTNSFLRYLITPIDICAQTPLPCNALVRKSSNLQCSSKFTTSRRYIVQQLSCRSRRLWLPPRSSHPCQLPHQSMQPQHPHPCLWSYRRQRRAHQVH